MHHYKDWNALRGRHDVNGMKMQNKSVQPQRDAFCIRCGARIEPNDSFCTRCGAKIETPEQTPDKDLYASENTKEKENNRPKSGSRFLILVIIIILVVTFFGKTNSSSASVRNYTEAEG